MGYQSHTAGIEKVFAELSEKPERCVVRVDVAVGMHHRPEEIFVVEGVGREIGCRGEVCPCCWANWHDRCCCCS